MADNLPALLYVASGILFILALRGLSNPETARQGNRFGMTGMAIAVLTTLFVLEDKGFGTWVFVLVAIAAAWGWRNAFFLAGIPGIVTALLIWKFIDEPPEELKPARRHTAPVAFVSRSSTSRSVEKSFTEHSHRVARISLSVFSAALE